MALLSNTLANIYSVTNHISWANSTFMGGKLTGLYLNDSCQFLQVPAKSPSGDKFCTRTFARRKSVKKWRRDEQSQNGMALESTEKGLEEERVLLSDKSSLEDDSVESVQITVNNIASRSDVLQACTVTSGLIAALGILIRQVSHVASMEGLPILDCSSEVSFGIEMWHLELITGLVILVSSCRYLLLKTWPDFAESSEAANQQVLTSLQPSDYVVVSFLPGVTEELLFRGALLPLFGMDWKSVLLAATIFGVLHLGNGRKYSFAVWATFVGFVYGFATIVSSSLVVPMASHALNNLAGGLLWRLTSKPAK
ncbi:CAAX AMINO TERMINAL PROTEASE FAMILY PROTEIN [Salix purpurea]|uniref:CAAX AMINO TERMINAL PROTEASE FAMILY PROTEIN n=1 Tax=Salix purpurea TaxID=77065 RepID=A0A9Q0U977_SALPP|nr:CAAX AMINO TERMINAL PROTEASE FAMILY PROTEIN [Salix purpurea]